MYLWVEGRPIDQALWVLTLAALALLGLPWAQVAFGGLTTRGLALAAPVGFFVFHYIAWLGLFTGLFRNGQGYAWAVFGLFAIASLALAWATRTDLRKAWPQQHIWTIGAGVLLVAYGVGVWMRWLNPEIVGTEKPMDLALLSGTMRSPTFPPSDPWFAGESINYYYLGYSMAGLLGHMTGTPPEVAYNLYLATLVAFVVVGVGSAAYDLTSMLGGTPRRGLQAAMASVVIGVVAGNLAITRAIVTEEFRGQTGFWQGIGWNASRVINRDPINGIPDTTINEFPAFSFILGDLHPHVMALPFVIVATTIVLQAVARWWRGYPASGWTSWANTLLTGMLVGGLYGINAWDFPTFLVLFLGAGILAHIAGPGPHNWLQLLAHTAVALVGAIGAWLPYTLNFGLLSEGVGVVPTRSLALDFAQVFGLVLLLALGSLAALLLDGSRWGRWLIGGSVIVSSLAIIAMLGEVIGALVVALLLALTVMVRQRRSLGAFTMALLVAAALGLLVLVEIVYVDDFFGPPYVRMNTVFKVHYQAWVLLGVAAGPALYITMRRLSSAKGQAVRVVRAAYVSAVVLMTVVGLSYTAVALRDKAAASQVSGTLDGLAQAELHFADDLAAARWLAQNAHHAAVVLEAPGSPYSNDSRISTWSGVPTVIGWNQHEKLWRGAIPAISERELQVEIAFTTLDTAESLHLMQGLGVTHVVFGQIERSRYGPSGESRMGSFLEPVASFGTTTIFAVPEKP